MEMVDSVQIAQYTSLALLFALVVTGAWKKSFTNTILVVTTVIFINLIIAGCVEWAVVLVVAVQFITTVRAILHKRNDEILRGIC